MSHYKQLFFTANGGLFERPTAAFFYHAGCCRHAAHGVGDGGDDKEENSFSDWRRHRHQKGEADNSRHGFLYLNPAIIGKNGLYVRLYDYLCSR